MSKWIKKDAFAMFREKIKEDESKKTDFIGRWPTPDKGTAEQPIEYEHRLIPDPKGNFYMKILYHMFKVDDKWVFSLCPKTYDMNNWCSCCSTSMKLYTGTASDKSEAIKLKRKEKYVVNSYIVDDPRDANRDTDKKVNNTVRLYEFPGKVEALIRASMTNEKNGVGIGAFDPSDDGYNFILSVGATKPDAEKKTWADYSLSTFARKPSPLADSDEKIEEILKQAYDLEEYIKTLEKDEKEIITAIKDLGYYDLISTEYERHRKSTSSDSTSSDKTESSPKVEQESTQKVESTAKKQTQTSNDLDETDEELLKELENLMI